jgi:hypothetical protein
MSSRRCSIIAALVGLVLLAPAQTWGAASPADTLEAETEAPVWRKVVATSAHLGMYTVATKVGSRFGLDRRFKVVRLENAYAYDVFAHIWAVNQLSQLFTEVDEWAGMSPRTASRTAAWGTAFGALTYMEIINGFMPNVRFDPADPIANAIGALMATRGPEVVARHPWMERLSFEFGYKDWGRVFGPKQQTGFAGNVWHDYPNGRFAVGYGLGPKRNEWARLFATYEITSFDVEELKNRFGVGLELKPQHWVAPLIRKVPGGSHLLAVTDWFDQRLLLPGLYIQLWTFDTGPFSDQQLFQE